MPIALRGCLALSDFLGDFVVYRRLEPADQRLPGLPVLAAELGLEPGRIPRKTELDYARVVASIFRSAAQLTGGPRTLRQLVAIGDTRMNDVSAFRNLCEVTGWQGLAVICSERLEEPAKLEEVEPGVFLANRWRILGELPQLAASHGIALDESTAVVIDIDKTAIGARGRNDAQIDAARVEGVRRTAAAMLGGNYNEQAFLEAYHYLHPAPFHPFTADNQDYLVYIALAIAAGLYSLEEIVQRVRSGELRSFAQFIEEVNARTDDLAGSMLAPVHAEVYPRFIAGDPTPFKTFRRHEFRATIERMGCLNGEPDPAVAMRSEIVLTWEVVQLTRHLQALGATVIGISDKPDEAAVPGPADRDDGYPALHRAASHCLGEDLA